MVKNIIGKHKYAKIYRTYYFGNETVIKKCLSCLLTNISTQDLIYDVLVS